MNTYWTRDVEDRGSKSKRRSGGGECVGGGNPEEKGASTQNTRARLTYICFLGSKL